MLLVSIRNAGPDITHVKPAREMRCVICNAGTLKALGEIVGYQAGRTFLVFECAICKTGVVDPCQSDDKLYDAIYRNVATVPGYSRYHYLAEELLLTSEPLDTISRVEDSYYAVIKTLAERVRDKARTKICEVGCGQGYLTYSLVKSGYDCTGIDIAAKAVDLARKRYGNYYFCGTISDFGAHCAKPDIVIATELIEHLEDPVQFLRSMMDTLGETGVVILTTPHKPGRNQEIWDTELPPVHLWWFTKSGMTAMAKQIGCRIDFVDLTNFYDANPDYYRLSDRPCEDREPVFNDQYEIINPASRPEGYGTLGRRMKRALPNWMVRKLQRIRAGKSFCVAINDANSRSMAAIFSREATRYAIQSSPASTDDA